jgi:uncharacterized membrane protein
VSLHDTIERVVHGFEIAGVTILVVGSLLALVRAAVNLRRGATAAYQRARQDVGRAILLGLAVLIIADIVLTITVEQTVESTLTLGLIVLVRTFLGFSLEIEFEGTLPWRRGLDGEQVGRRASEADGDARGTARRPLRLSAQPAQGRRRLRRHRRFAQLGWTGHIDRMGDRPQHPLRRLMEPSLDLAQ